MGALRRWLWLCALLGCAVDEAEPAPVEDAAGPREASSDAAPPASPCARLDLAARCPPGSHPQIITEGCAPSETLWGGDGQATGVCAREGECLFACNFTDPCPCGVDAITDEGVLCTPCGEAAACGDAVCDRGEGADACPVDCGAVCAPGNARCDGDLRQECEDNGRWASLACRDDQLCQFGADADRITAVCQTRISEGGGAFVGFGPPPPAPARASHDIRFRETTLDAPGIRFVEGGQRVLVRVGDDLEIHDPSGLRPPEATHIIVARDALATSPTRVARGRRWPQLSEPLEGTTRTVEAMVHDGAIAEFGACALSGDGRRLAATFALGRAGGEVESMLATWTAEDGRLEALARFVDEALEPSRAPGPAVALSHDGAMAIEARPGGALIVWDLAERRYAHLIHPDVGATRKLLTHAAGDLLAVCGQRAVELWVVDAEGATRRWRQGAACVDLAFSPDGRVLAVGEGAAVTLRAVEDGREHQRFQEGGALDFDPRGGRLLIGEAIYTSSL